MPETSDLIFPRPTDAPPSSWREEFKHLITDIKQLADLLGLDFNQLQSVRVNLNAFPLRVSRSFVSRMKKGDINDPLLKQVLPNLAELTPQPTNYVKDPLQETAFNPLPGAIHKYRTRLLLIMGGLCAAHCRYCFRRHFAYDEQPLSLPNLQKILAYIGKHPEINEVIFSGGDPLSLGMGKLAQVSNMLSASSQIKRIRVHTRLPILIPKCIDAAFIGWAKSLSPQLVMVVHCNHAQEINREVRQAMAALHEAGVKLFNQTVLLKGINDDAKALIDLSEVLFDMHVLPYYLHQLDPVIGAAHFDVSLERAQAILFHITSALPGYLVPKLATERPGYPFKLIHPPKSSPTSGA